MLTAENRSLQVSYDLVAHHSTTLIASMIQDWEAKSLRTFASEFFNGMEFKLHVVFMAKHNLQSSN